MGRPADDALIGRTIAGKFVVESFLGGGAMGAVYKAQQVSLGKRVAVKVLHKELVVDPTFIARFEREARAASLLDHPNSMRVLDYGRDPDGLCYIAMELLEGRTLFQLLKDDGRLSDPRIVDILRQTLAALAVAHDMGVVHRDLKPENIVILRSTDDEGGANEVVKVCDFGMAKIVARDEMDSGVEKLTSQGVVVGTPEYMSPEQGKGDPLDARSDIYAVGVILYQLLTERLPFHAETAIGILLKHLIEEPTPPSHLVPSVNPSLERVCLRALQKRPEERYASAREMRTELRHALEAGATGISDARSGQRVPPSPVPDEAPFPMRPAMTTEDRATAVVDRRRGQTMPSAVDAVRSVPPPPMSKALRGVVAGIVAAVAIVAAGLYAKRTFSKAHDPSALARPEQPPAVGHPDSLPAMQTGTGPGPPPASAPTETAPGSTTPGATVQANPGASVAPAAADSTPSIAAAATARGAVRPLASAPTSTRPTTAAATEAGATAATISAGSNAAGAPGAGNVGTASVPATSAGAANTAVVPAAPSPFDAARVVVGAIKGEHISGADVAAAMPLRAFNQCYRDGLRALGSATAGDGVLTLSLDGDGHITSASAAVPPALSRVGKCVADAAIGRNVRNAEPIATTAEIQLSFRGE